MIWVRSAKIETTKHTKCTKVGVVSGRHTKLITASFGFVSQKNRFDPVSAGFRQPALGENHGFSPRHVRPTPIFHLHLPAHFHYFIVAGNIALVSILSSKKRCIYPSLHALHGRSFPFSIFSRDWRASSCAPHFTLAARQPRFHWLSPFGLAITARERKILHRSRSGYAERQG